jgi:hypothetical protein
MERPRRSASRCLVRCCVRFCPQSGHRWSLEPLVLNRTAQSRQVRSAISAPGVDRCRAWPGLLAQRPAFRCLVACRVSEQVAVLGCSVHRVCCVEAFTALDDASAVATRCRERGSEGTPSLVVCSVVAALLPAGSCGFPASGACELVRSGALWATGVRAQSSTVEAGLQSHRLHPRAAVPGSLGRVPGTGSQSEVTCM